MCISPRAHSSFCTANVLGVWVAVANGMEHTLPPFTLTAANVNGGQSHQTAGGPQEPGGRRRGLAVAPWMDDLKR